MKHGVTTGIVLALLLECRNGIVEAEPFGDPERELAFALQLVIHEKVFPSGIVLRGSKPPLRGFDEHQLDAFAPLRWRRRWNDFVERVFCALTNDAGQLTLSVAVSMSAGKVL